MKKSILFVVCLTILSVTLSACQLKKTHQLPSASLKQVSISNSKEFGRVNTDFFKGYEDKETLDKIKKALSNAVKAEGVVDMAEPEYDLKVVDTAGNEQGYHLWVGEKGQVSTLMNVEDTHTIYTIPEELTSQFIDWVQ